MKTTEFIEKLYKIYEDNDYDMDQEVLIVDGGFWMEAEPIEIFMSDGKLHIGLRRLKKRNQETYKEN